MPEKKMIDEYIKGQSGSLEITENDSLKLYYANVFIYTSSAVAPRDN